MKAITSKKTGKQQIVSEKVWDDIVGRGWDKRFKVVDIQPKIIKGVPIIKPEELSKPKIKKSNG